MWETVLEWLCLLGMALFCLSACRAVYQEDKECRKERDET